jgi:hypothetical protein
MYSNDTLTQQTNNHNHPLQQNEQQYILYKKYISIHAEDRDIIKYPDSSHFEIELPQDLLNILTVKLVNWTFPPNNHYIVYSPRFFNVQLAFQINRPFNLSPAGYSIPIYDVIFTALFLNQYQYYYITIETGTYTPQQMAVELTRRMNQSVSEVVIDYLQNTTTPNYNPVEYPILLNQFIQMGGYAGFIVVHNEVTRKLWFGNRTDGFIISNSIIIKENCSQNKACIVKNKVPEFLTNVGLPGYLGLSIEDISATTSTDITIARFYYGDVTLGDNGYWLTPNPSLPGSQVYWVESPYPNTIERPNYLYLEILGLNSIDETYPFQLSEFTATTNGTNGVVQSAFAKINISPTGTTNANTAQGADGSLLPYKIFVPPAERMRRLKIGLRYHNGIYVDFGGFPWSFMLEFGILQPQQQRYMTPSLVNLQQLMI